MRERTILLSSFELKNAKSIWIKFIQRNIFSSKNYKLKNDLGFFFDSEGIIRCRGRLGNAPISYSVKFSIFLPKESRFTELIILDCHENVKHNGVKETLNQLILEFWIPKVKSLIQKLRNVFCVVGTKESLIVFLTFLRYLQVE